MFSSAERLFDALFWPLLTNVRGRADRYKRAIDLLRSSVEELKVESTSRLVFLIYGSALAGQLNARAREILHIRVFPILGS